ncbi:MAG TPA: energy transducer TonB [Blastocatellia bacterium]|nr:energy transducer TonB [Blastocatellia bacterium]
MNRLAIISLVLVSCCLLFCICAAAQEPARVAIADFAGEGQAAAALVRQMAAQDFTLVDEELVRAAMRGAGYTGSLNLSRDEARALGMSIGCDYYLLGVARMVRRIVSAEEFYYEGLAGLFTVETRTGRLLLFDFLRTRGGNEQTARAQLDEQLRQSWKKSAAAIVAAVRQNRTASETITQAPAAVIEVFGDEPQAQGLAQPIFYQHLKPGYTEAAESLSIIATVELEVVFGADGRVGEVEVRRWAGFGLDESAVATVRRLRFKPAERDGRPVALRALVRYNFRRPPSAAQLKEEEERLKRSLREAQRQPKPD